MYSAFYRKRKAEEEAAEEDRKKMQAEWDKNFEVRVKIKRKPRGRTTDLYGFLGFSVCGICEYVFTLTLSLHCPRFLGLK